LVLLFLSSYPKQLKPKPGACQKQHATHFAQFTKIITKSKNYNYRMYILENLNKESLKREL
jgi:hypothetical protein